MQRWKLTLEYDGTGLCGWQKQTQDPNSVQEILERAILSFSGEPARLVVAGRTDAGVHALGQVAHVDLARTLDAQTFMGAVGHYVRPHKISLLEAEPVAPDFHARFGAKARHYRYHIVNRRAPLALAANKAWHIVRPLDARAMQSAADLLLGTHDFTTFRAQGCQAKSPIKTIDKILVTRTQDEIILDVSARSFLYHQIRNIVGSLVFVGDGRWSVADFADALAACDRTRGGPTSPPDGLFFVRVDY